MKNYIRNKPLKNIFITPEKVLDLAGGEGNVSEWLLSKGFDVTLIDYSEESVKKAREKGVNAIRYNIDHKAILPFESGRDCGAQSSSIFK